MARTYYCNDCKKTIEFKGNEDYTCECGRMFGIRRNDTTRDPCINMRNNAWTKTTQVEFSQTTMDQDISERNAR